MSFVVGYVVKQNHFIDYLGYMMTMNADVANKPATKNLHLTEGPDSYIKVKQFMNFKTEVL